MPGRFDELSATRMWTAQAPLSVFCLLSSWILSSSFAAFTLGIFQCSILISLMIFSLYFLNYFSSGCSRDHHLHFIRIYFGSALIPVRDRNAAPVQFRPLFPSAVLSLRTYHISKCYKPSSMLLLLLCNVMLFKEAGR